MSARHGHGEGVFDDEPHIPTSSGERLVIMANQIARFFAAQKHDQAVEGVRSHIARFWDPRMRQTIRDHLAAGGRGLEPLAREAVGLLTK
jgi:formate dehydrogenase subunit delta